VKNLTNHERKLRATLADLPEGTRRALLLHLDSLSVADVALALMCPVPEVERDLERAWSAVEGQLVELVRATEGDREKLRSVVERIARDAGLITPYNEDQMARYDEEYGPFEPISEDEARRIGDRIRGRSGGPRQAGSKSLADLAGASEQPLFPRRYWVVRPDPDQLDFLHRELVAGRLRQGWGYDPSQDLRIVRRVPSRERTGPQRDAWKRCRRMLETEPDGMRPGDIVISPKLPAVGSWSVSRIVGDYDFTIPDRGDYGHLRPVELLGTVEDTNVDFVDARLRETMRCRLSMWNIDRLGPCVDRLVNALREGKPGRRQEAEEVLRNAVERLQGTLWDAFREAFEGKRFEGPCVLLLKRLFGADNVEYTAGPTERGADAVCTYQDPLGCTHTVVVQVKMWEHEAYSLVPFEQIREAVENYPNVTSGVVLTTTHGSGAEFDEARERTEQELGIPLRVIHREELLQLFLRHLPDMLVGDPAAD